MKFGPDVSHYDTLAADETRRPIDWAKAGADVALIKIGEAYSKDPSFDMQWAAAKGIVPRVAWYWIRYNRNAITGAQRVTEWLKDFDPRYDYLALDAEGKDDVDAPARLRQDLSWLYEVAKVIPTANLIYYTNQSHWIEGGGPTNYATAGKRYKLWLADPVETYFGGNPLLTPDMFAEMKGRIQSGYLKPHSLAPWGKPDIWQFTWRAKPECLPTHPGVKKAIDFNAFFMDIGAPVPPPVTEPATEPVDVDRLAVLWREAVAHGWNLTK